MGDALGGGARGQNWLLRNGEAAGLEWAPLGKPGRPATQLWIAGPGRGGCPSSKSSASAGIHPGAHAAGGSWAAVALPGQYGSGPCQGPGALLLRPQASPASPAWLCSVSADTGRKSPPSRQRGPGSERRRHRATVPEPTQRIAPGRRPPGDSWAPKSGQARTRISTSNHDPWDPA